MEGNASTNRRTAKLLNRTAFIFVVAPVRNVLPDVCKIPVSFDRITLVHKLLVLLFQHVLHGDISRQF